MTIKFVSAEEAIKLGFGDPSLIVSPRLRKTSSPLPKNEGGNSVSPEENQEKKELPTNKKIGSTSRKKIK